MVYLLKVDTNMLKYCCFFNTLVFTIICCQTHPNGWWQNISRFFQLLAQVCLMCGNPPGGGWICTPRAAQVAYPADLGEPSDLHTKLLPFSDGCHSYFFRSGITTVVKQPELVEGTWNCCWPPFFFMRANCTMSRLATWPVELSSRLP